jgi:alkylhydroperoxidase/carboxymuconolactone decarboxylase family protein YurZ
MRPASALVGLSPSVYDCGAAASRRGEPPDPCPKESGVTYLPEIYERFRADFPDVAAAYDALSGTLHEAGPLDQRTRRLVKLGIAVGAEAEGGVRSHVRKALAEGISPREIEHAILLSFTTAGFPAMVAALKWAREVLDTPR